MENVEIEVGQWADGSGKWGCVIHYYEVGENRFEYDGNSGEFGRCDSEDEAREMASGKLDELYGKGGWKHI